MSKAVYATTQKFDGQRASLTRMVLIKIGGSVVGAQIYSVHADDTIGALVIGAAEGERYAPEKFRACKSEEDLDTLEEGQWTWPPRV